MDTQSVANDPRAHTDGETGALAGLSPIERLNRAQHMLDGLSNLQTLFESAMRAPPEHQSTQQVWSPVLYLSCMVADDVSHELSAMWADLRPLWLAAKAGAKS